MGWVQLVMVPDHRMHLEAITRRHEVMHISVHSQPLVFLFQLLKHGPGSPMSGPVTLVKFRHDSAMISYPITIYITYNVLYVMIY